MRKRLKIIFWHKIKLYPFPSIQFKERRLFRFYEFSLKSIKYFRRQIITHSSSRSIALIYLFLILIIISPFFPRQREFSRAIDCIEDLTKQCKMDTTNAAHFMNEQFDVNEMRESANFLCSNIGGNYVILLWFNSFYVCFCCFV